MKALVYGFGNLGKATASQLDDLGFSVYAYDKNRSLVDNSNYSYIEKDRQDIDVTFFCIPVLNRKDFVTLSALASVTNSEVCIRSTLPQHVTLSESWSYWPEFRTEKELSLKSYASTSIIGYKDKPNWLSQNFSKNFLYDSVSVETAINAKLLSNNTFYVVSTLLYRLVDSSANTDRERRVVSDILLSKLKSLQYVSPDSISKCLDKDVGLSLNTFIDDLSSQAKKLIPSLLEKHRLSELSSIKLLGLEKYPEDASWEESFIVNTVLGSVGSCFVSVVSSSKTEASFKSFIQNKYPRLSYEKTDDATTLSFCPQKIKTDIQLWY